LTVDDSNRSIEMVSDAGRIELPGNMLANTELDTDENVEISISKTDKSLLSEELQQAIGDKPVVQLRVMQGDNIIQWDNPDAPVSVSIPYTPTEAELADPEHIVVWYIDGEGNVFTVPDGRYDPETGMVTFTTTHFSSFAVAYVYKTFEDLDNAQWARKAVEVLASKGIISGTGNDMFSPDANITRADFIVLLVKTLGLAAKPDGNFADVQPGDYYYESLGIAKRLGLATGVGNNMFNPKAYISSQDMSVLTARALERYKGLKPAGDAALLDGFIDKGEMAGYATGYMASLVEEGLITGDGVRLKPCANTTRAEAAVFLYRIYNKY
jgi:hypothetical protein